MRERVSGSFDPEPIFEFRRPAWQGQAACHPDVIPPVWQKWGDHPVDLFFPQTQYMPPERRRDIESICSTCPVRQECDTWGTLHEKFGFWGGHGSKVLQDQRRDQGITVDTPEIDSYNRQVIGTHIPPSHGTPARYQQHLRDGDKPCILCIEANRLDVREANAARWVLRKKLETPAERAHRLAVRNANRKPYHRA